MEKVTGLELESMDGKQVAPETVCHRSRLLSDNKWGANGQYRTCPIAKQTCSYSIVFKKFSAAILTGFPFSLQIFFKKKTRRKTGSFKQRNVNYKGW
jgi:hypothetical protein